MIPIEKERDIRKLLKAKGLTVKEIAQASGVSRSTVDRIKAMVRPLERPRNKRKGRGECSRDLGLLDPTGKFLFSAPPWHSGGVDYETLVAATGPGIIGNTYTGFRVTCGAPYDDSYGWDKSVVHLHANTRLIANAPGLFLLAHDLYSLGKLKLIDHTLFEQLTIRVRHILKKVRGTV